MSEHEKSAEDREICLCFHVPLNKIVKYVRLHDPKVASELSNCYGAGTGCGWCIPFLTKIYEQVKAGQDPTPEMSAAEYRARRAEYRKSLNLDQEVENHD